MTIVAKEDLQMWTRFSSYSKLTRVLAWVLKAIKMFKIPTVKNATNC